MMRLELALIVSIIFFCCWCAYIIIRMQTSVMIAPPQPSPNFTGAPEYHQSSVDTSTLKHAVHPTLNPTPDRFKQIVASDLYASSPPYHLLRQHHNQQAKVLLNSTGPWQGPPYASTGSSAQQTPNGSWPTKISTNYSHSTWQPALHSSTAPRQQLASYPNYQWQAQQLQPTHLASSVSQPSVAAAHLPELDPNPDQNAASAPADDESEESPGEAGPDGSQEADDEANDDEEEVGPPKEQVDEKVGRRSYSEEQSDSQERDRAGNPTVSHRRYLINGKPANSSHPNATQSDAASFDQVVREIDDQPDEADESQADDESPDEEDNSQSTTTTDEPSASQSRRSDTIASGGLIDATVQPTKRTTKIFKAKGKRLKEDFGEPKSRRPIGKDQVNERRVKETLSQQQWDDDDSLNGSASDVSLHRVVPVEPNPNGAPAPAPRHIWKLYKSSRPATDQSRHEYKATQATTTDDVTRHWLYGDNFARKLVAKHPSTPVSLTHRRQRQQQQTNPLHLAGLERSKRQTKTGANNFNGRQPPAASDYVTTAGWRDMPESSVAGHGSEFARNASDGLDLVLPGRLNANQEDIANRWTVGSRQLSGPNETVALQHQLPVYAPSSDEMAPPPPFNQTINHRPAEQLNPSADMNLRVVSSSGYPLNISADGNPIGLHQAAALPYPIPMPISAQVGPPPALVNQTGASDALDRNQAPFPSLDPTGPVSQQQTQRNYAKLDMDESKKKQIKEKKHKKKKKKKAQTSFKASKGQASKKYSKFNKGAKKKKKNKVIHKLVKSKKDFKGSIKGAKQAKGAGHKGAKKGALYHKDKGYRKRGFKKHYEKMETGDHKTYFDEFRDKDTKKKWKDFKDKHNYSQSKKWTGNDFKKMNKFGAKDERDKKASSGRWKDKASSKYNKEFKSKSKKKKKYGADYEKEHS